MFDAQALLKEFESAANSAGLDGWPCRIRLDRQIAPHLPPKLPAGWAAIYIFSLSEQFGAHTAAGPGRVLKVGKAGAQSGPRFTYQHYGFSARSTLARSLLRHRILWPWLGISNLDESNVKAWMLQNLDRTHFLVEAGHQEVVDAAEVFVRACVGSVFEGA